MTKFQPVQAGLVEFRGQSFYYFLVSLSLLFRFEFEIETDRSESQPFTGRQAVLSRPLAFHEHSKRSTKVVVKESLFCLAQSAKT